MFGALYFLGIIGLTLAACPTGTTYNSPYFNGSYTASPNENCSFTISSVTDDYQLISFSVANVGANDKVIISSRKGSVTITNRKYFAMKFTVFISYHIQTVAGASSSMAIQLHGRTAHFYNKAENLFAVKRIDISDHTDSAVIYLSEWEPQTQLNFRNGASHVILQRAEIASDPVDLLQWSNVLMTDGGLAAISSVFQLAPGTSTRITNYDDISLYLTQPIRRRLTGAILITSSNYLDNLSNFGVAYVNPNLPSQDISFGASNGKESCFTVIGAPDGSTPIDVRMASPGVTVINGGPGPHSVELSLNNLPVTLVGNIWTFYVPAGAAAVRFSVSG